MDQNAIAVGIAMLVLIALPSWIGVYYWTTHSLEDVSAAYGMARAFLKRRWIFRVYVCAFALCGGVFGALAVFLVAAGAGSAAARHVLTLF